MKCMKTKNNYLILISAFLLLSTNLFAQRKMENLDRGLVAVKTNEGVYVNWRITGQEWYDVAYNLYRDGTKVNQEPIAGASNYLDASGSNNSKYKIVPVINKQEKNTSDIKEVSVLANPWIEIPLREIPKIAGVPDSYYNEYSINDITAADLDGDGEYELIVKRRNEGYDSAKPFENKYYTLIEAYKLNGTHLWTIDLGPNLIHNVEINVLAFDFDGDGKAEIVMRSSEGTIDGKGNMIGDVANANGQAVKDGKTNYRDGFQKNNSWFEYTGPEFLSLYDGETGEELDRINHIARQPASQWGSSGQSASQLAHRSTKFHYGAPYFNGKTPSIFISRGIYHRIKMESYDIENKKFVKKWAFDSEDGKHSGYSGQGNHNYSIADVDGDGYDEIVYGSMVVDHNGKGLYTTGLGHGDAIHVGDFDPYRKGLEVFACLENNPHYGASLRAAESGLELWHHNAGRDMGRAMAANFTDKHLGFEVWDNDVMHSASERKDINIARGSTIFRIFWDGDVLHELVGHDWNETTRKGIGTISKYNDNSNSWSNIFRSDGYYSCNDTKGTPCFQADLFGDWREEIIFRSDDDRKIRIYFTTTPSEHRIYTLMHDMQYRQAIAWQMCGYNQPPHASYFLGERENLLLPPPPVMDNQRLVFSSGNVWDKTTSNWTKDGSVTSYQDGEDVLFDYLSMNGNSSIQANGTLSPRNVFINSNGNHTIEASEAKLSGSMRLIKQGCGSLSLNGNHDYSGSTEIWDGFLGFSGNLSNSTVLLHFFGEIGIDGTVGKELNMRHHSILYAGGKEQIGSTTVGENLTIEEHAFIHVDLDAKSNSDRITINGKFEFPQGFTIQINKLEETIPAGDYELFEINGEINGDLSAIVLTGYVDKPVSIKQIGNKIILTVVDIRDPSSVLWSGAQENGLWDFNNTKNFTLNGEETVFVSYDDILFDDSGINKTIDLSGSLAPKCLTFDSSEDYTIRGTGKLLDPTSITKKGSGKLTISNTNEYSGETIIEEGTLQVSSLPIDDKASSIGYTGKLTLDGGCIGTNGVALTTTQPLTIGNAGGSIYAIQSVTWNAKISGGELIKTGSGILNLNKANSIKRLVIKNGTVKLTSEEASIGSSLVFEKGTLYTFDSNGSYSNASWKIEVPGTASGSIYLDGRCNYTGALTGEGTLNIYVSWIRTYLQGDWSKFTGTINFRTYGSSSDNRDLLFDNSNGLPHAEVNIDSPFPYITNVKKTTFRIGGLKGGKGAVMNGAHAWEIGNRNTDSSYEGTITGAGSVIKVGTADLTLSGANSYTAGTTVKGGRLFVSNTTGSATGTGNVTVETTASLGGTGKINGKVTVRSGGSIDLSDIKTAAIYLNGGFSIASGGKVVLDINPRNSTSDVIHTATATLDGILELNKLSSLELKEGSSFKIIEATTITGSFSEILCELPEGLKWDQSEIADGIVKIVRNTGIEDLGQSIFAIYPNPVQNQLNIDLRNYSGTIQLSLLSVNGRLIGSEEETAGQIITRDVSKLSPGYYIVKIVCENKIEIKKFVKR